MAYTLRMALKATTLRMSEDLWELLEEEAARQGVSAAHVVRDSVLLRLGHLSAARGDSAAQLTIEQLAARSLQERRRHENQTHTTALGEPHRLAALRTTGLLDGPADPGLETLAHLCAKLLNVPITLISLVEADRQFLAGSCGLAQPWASERQMRLSHSFCQHVVVSRQPFVVSDAREHPLVRENLAIRDLGVIAYVGIPLTTPDDHVLGSFCAIDNKPRTWTKTDLDTLTNFAQSALAHIGQGNRTPQKPQP
jgi:GAF domain-containing protein